MRSSVICLSRQVAPRATAATQIVIRLVSWPEYPTSHWYRSLNMGIARRLASVVGIGYVELQCISSKGHSAVIKTSTTLSISAIEDMPVEMNVFFLSGCGHKQNSPRNLENTDTNQGDLEDVIAVYQTG